MTGSTVQMHGKVYTPSWTTLSTTVTKGSATIQVSESTQWRVGDKIVIASSDYSDLYNWDEDTRDSLLWKRGFGFKDQTEERTIKRIINAYTFELNSPLNYTHFSQAPDMMCEVAVLNRNIVFTGDSSSDTSLFGGHIMVRPTASKCEIKGIEITKMGLSGIMGRYPIHFHVWGEHANSNPGAFYLKDSSIHDTYQRCVVVHDTNGLVIQGNVCYNTVGHQYFLEDGPEMSNSFIGNLGLKAIPVPNEDTKQLIKSESSPAIFWITNANNTFIGNHAVGGRFSYWFTQPANPTGLSATKYGTNNYYVRPRNQPLGVFRDNVAHGAGENALHIDDMVKPDTTTEPEAFVPLRGPYPVLDYWVAPDYVDAIFENFVAWKNRGYGIWSRSAHLVFRNCRLYDNRIGMNAPPNGPVLFENCYIVAETANVGEVTSMRSQVDKGGRTRPGQWSSEEVLKGMEHYDNGGPQLVRNVTFVGFKTDQYRAAGSLSGLSYAPFKHQTKNKYADMKFIDSNVYYQYDSFYDSHKGTTVLDVDGSSTGLKPNGWIVSNDSLLIHPKCEAKSEWNGFKCPVFPESYGQLEVLNLQFSSTSNTGSNGVNYPDLSDPSKRVMRMKVIDLKRGSSSSVIGATSSGSPNVLALLSNIVMRNLYTLRWAFNTPTPSQLQLSLRSNAHSDWVIIAIQYPTGSTFEVVRKTWSQSPLTLSSVDSLSALMDNPDSYYYESYSQHLYIKLENRAGLDAWEEWRGFSDYAYDGISITIKATCPSNSCSPTKFDYPTNYATLLQRNIREERYAGVLQTCQQNLVKSVNTNTGSGYVFAFANPVKRTVDFSVYHDLSSIVTKVEVGIGLPGAEKRIVQRPYKISPYTVSRFTLQYTYDEYVSLLKGEVFVKLSTSQNPNGHLRAQIYCNNGKRDGLPNCSLPPTISTAKPCDAVPGALNIYSEKTDITGWPDWDIYSYTDNIDTNQTYVNYSYTESPICGATSILFGTQRGAIQIYHHTGSPMPSIDTAQYKYFEFFAKAKSGGPVQLGIAFFKYDSAKGSSVAIGNLEPITNSYIQHFMIDDQRVTRVRIPLSAVPGFTGQQSLQTITIYTVQPWNSAIFREVIIDNLRFVKETTDVKSLQGINGTSDIVYFNEKVCSASPVTNPDSDPLGLITFSALPAPDPIPQSSTTPSNSSGNNSKLSVGSISRANNFIVGLLVALICFFLI